MSCHNKETLENMLEDVVNVLDLSEGMIEEHGPLGTPPAELVRLVLQRKDQEIAMLRAGFKGLYPADLSTVTAERDRLRDALQNLVQIHEGWNEAVQKIIGKPVGWSDSYLCEARHALEDSK